MPFTVPNFNLAYSVWHDPNVPPNPPDGSGMCNLAYGRRIAWAGGGELALRNLLMTALLPAGEDIRSTVCGGFEDILEVPAGSGRFYLVSDVDDIGKGFPNEHRVAILIASTTYGFWPIPIP